jgi:hypothetical protein
MLPVRPGRHADHVRLAATLIRATTPHRSEP